VQLDYQVKMVLTVLLELLVLKVLQVQLVYQVKMDLTVLPVRLVLKVL
jgi:hypothetical protein